MEKDNELTLFEGKNIRKIWHDEQWYFSVIDVIEVLTDSPIPRNYWSILKKREPQLHTVCMQLKMAASDGRQRLTDCANTEGVFRIIMSVPSPKAEPLKLWLASLGKQAIDEAENPELLTDRQAELYRAKGYTEEWIMRRVQSIEARNRLTDEWKKRGVNDSREYSILTAVIANGTFGLTPSEHKEIKGLDKQNLRDHMTPIELIFSALGEETTRLLTERDDVKGYIQSHEAATEGGRIAGRALGNFEKDAKLKVVSSNNFLHLKGSDTPNELSVEEPTKTH